MKTILKNALVSVAEVIVVGGFGTTVVLGLSAALLLLQR